MPIIPGVPASGGGQQPDTPTIGTASNASSTSQRVAFTASAYTGKATPITYRAIAFNTSNAEVGRTGTATTPPITVTGLTANTSYKYQVEAFTPAATSLRTGFSNTVTTPPPPPSFATPTFTTPTFTTPTFTTPTFTTPTFTTPTFTTPTFTTPTFTNPCASPSCTNYTAPDGSCASGIGVFRRCTGTGGVVCSDTKTGCVPPPPPSFTPPATCNPPCQAPFRCIGTVCGL